MKALQLKRIILLAAVFTLLGSRAASAAKYGYEIDPEAMKTMEEESTFPVKVTEKKVVEECLDVENYDPSDILSLTVTNGSDTEISAVRIQYVAYDENNRTADISGGRALLQLQFSMGADTVAPEIYTLGKEELAIQPGESFAISTAVDYGSFTGLRAMVEYYVTSDGTQVDNPSFPMWQNLAYGLEATGNVTELD